MAFLGTICGDIFWFKIGERYGRKFIQKCGHWFFITPSRFEKIEKLISKKGAVYLVISKFLYSLNHISLIAAGAIHFNFARFVRLQIIISAFWTVCFISLGYLFAHSLAKIIKDVRIFSLLFLAAVAAYIALNLILEKIFFKKAESRQRGL
jgi:membrane protein DedA with SNARE-associated domain